MGIRFVGVLLMYLQQVSAIRDKDVVASQLVGNGMGNLDIDSGTTDFDESKGERYTGLLFGENTIDART